METVYVRFFKDLPFMVDVSVQSFEQKSFYRVEQMDIVKSNFSLDLASVPEGNYFNNTLNPVSPRATPGQYTFVEDFDTKPPSNYLSRYIFDKEGFVKGLMKQEGYIDEQSEYFMKCLTSNKFGFNGQFPKSIAEKIIQKKTKQDLFMGVDTPEKFYESLNPIVHQDVHGLKGVSKENFDYIMKALCSFEMAVYNERGPESEHIDVFHVFDDIDVSILDDNLPAFEKDDTVEMRAAKYLGITDLYKLGVMEPSEGYDDMYHSVFKKDLRFFKEAPRKISFIASVKRPEIIRTISRYCKKVKPVYNEMLAFVVTHDRLGSSAANLIFEDVINHINRTDIFRTFVKQAILPHVGKEWKLEKACNIFEPLDATAMNQLCEYYSIDLGIPRQRKCMELYLVLKRLRQSQDTGTCNNTETSISGDKVTDIDPRLLFTFEENGRKYCENIEELHEYIQQGGDTNPFTNVPLTDDTIQRVKTEYSKLGNIKRMANGLAALEIKPVSQLWADLIGQMYYAPGYDAYKSADLYRINLLRIYAGLDDARDLSNNDDRQLITALIDKEEDSQTKEYYLTTILLGDPREILQYLDRAPEFGLSPNTEDASETFETPELSSPETEDEFYDPIPDARPTRTGTRNVNYAESPLTSPESGSGSEYSD